MIQVDSFEDGLSDAEVRQLHAAAKAKRLRVRHPYVFDLIKVLAPHESLQRRMVLHLVRQNLERAKRPIPPSLNEFLQVTIQHYCVDSDVFRQRGAPAEEGLFCWPRGKSTGIWALQRENAAALLYESRQRLRNAARG